MQHGHVLKKLNFEGGGGLGQNMCYLDAGTFTRNLIIWRDMTFSDIELLLFECNSGQIFFLLVDLRDFFSDLGSEGRKKINKKALKMTS